MSRSRPPDVRGGHRRFGTDGSGYSGRMMRFAAIAAASSSAASRGRRRAGQTGRHDRHGDGRHLPVGQPDGDRQPRGQADGLLLPDRARPPSTAASRRRPASPAGGRRSPRGGPVGGLRPVTKYFYRVVAVSAGGTTLGGGEDLHDAEDPPVGRHHRRPQPDRLRRPPDRGRDRVGDRRRQPGGHPPGEPVSVHGRLPELGNPVLTTATGSFGFNLLALPVTTQFRVVSIGGGQAIASPVTTEYVDAGRDHAGHPPPDQARLVHDPLRRHGRPGRGRRAGRRPAARRPHVEVRQGRRRGRRRPGRSSYSVTIHAHHGGFYRVGRCRSRAATYRLRRGHPRPPRRRRLLASRLRASHRGPAPGRRPRPGRSAAQADLGAATALRKTA